MVGVRVLFNGKIVKIRKVEYQLNFDDDWVKKMLKLSNFDNDYE